MSQLDVIFFTPNIKKERRGNVGFSSVSLCANNFNLNR